MMRISYTFIGLASAALLSACGNGENAELSSSTQTSSSNSSTTKSSRIKTVSAADAAACVASSTSKRVSDKVGNEKTCTLEIPNQLTMKIFTSKEPGCRPIVIGVAPQTNTTSAVRLVTSHNDGKKYYSSVSLRNRALPDRLSGWVYYGAIDGYPEEPCDTLDFKLEEVLCKRGMSLSAQYEPCDDIVVETPEMFKSADMDSL